ncbi:unnamed protein product [Auanema sp. JU1783]|nr:unnamed protein product [Auanema sp. JU1783]
MTEKIEEKPMVRTVKPINPQMEMPILQDPRRDVAISSLEERMAALEETQRLLEQFSLFLKSLRVRNEFK